MNPLTAHPLTIQSPAIPLHLGQAALEPVRLSGREGVNSLFEYTLLLKTPDSLSLGASSAADFNLDDFIGREISCSIELDGMGAFITGVVGASTDHIGAGERQINALITKAALWGEEGRHLQYQLTLRPWLQLATLSTDCKIFQNKSVVDILDELLADYPFPVDKRLFGPGGQAGEHYPALAYQCQYNESDFAFFERLCQEWGISYHFEHSGGKHRLVLSDALAAYRPNPSAAYQHIEYHAPGWKLDAEYLHSFVPTSRLTSGQYSTTDYDYTRPRADLHQSRQDPRPTGQAGQEVYQWHAAQAGSAGSHYAQTSAGTESTTEPQAQGRFAALLRMQQLRTHGNRAQASGNLRAMVPGCTFELRQHPRQSANAAYLILETNFLIENTAQDSQGLQNSLAQQWRVSVDITAHPLTETLRPYASRAKPHTYGPQSALVVGPEGQNLWTDSLGRIKVQFPWDRLGHKNQHSSCWVRISTGWGGNQMGASHIPRIGQEVLIDFEGGDPDLPICTGKVHNQLNLPAWKLPEQAALSGFRSRELTAEGGNSAMGRSNHLVMDDTEGKIQAQLKSDHQHSSLSLGFITRVEDNAGRKDARGEGFELRTDGHGVLRAKDGLLISTEARGNAQAHAKDMGETVQRLVLAKEQHQSLASLAEQHRAQAKGDQDEVAQAIKAQNAAIEGKGGNGGQGGQGGQGGHAGEGRFAELAAPHLVLSSAAGVSVTAADGLHLATGADLALTSSGHTSLATGKSLLASAAQAIRLFAHQAGIRLFAAKGAVQIQAQDDQMALIAKKVLELISTTDWITLTAKEGIALSVQGSQMNIEPQGFEYFTTGKHHVWAADDRTMGPREWPVGLPQFPRASLQNGGGFSLSA